MQYQIPTQSSYVANTGATIGGEVGIGVTVIDTFDSRYRQDVAPQIHQGATVVQYTAMDSVKMEYPVMRQLPKPKTLVEHQGAPKVRTDPIPPVSQPLFRYYLPDENRYIDANDNGRMAQNDGAIKVRTDPIPKTNQPEFRYYLPDANRYIWEGPEQMTDGATVRPTFPVPPVSKPEFAYYKVEVNRYIDEVIKRFEGAPRNQTFPIPPVSQPLNYGWDENRYVDQIIKRYEGSTLQQTYIFPISEPEFRYYVTNTFSDVVQRTESAVTQTPQTYIFYPNQPEFRYYVPDINGYGIENTGPVNQYDGAIKQQTYVFYPSQPEFRYYLRNTFSEVFAQLHFTSVGPQQTYVFPVNEPEFRYYLRNTFSDVFSPIQGATIQQTYIFPLSQPEFRYYLKNTSFDTNIPPIQGATVHQTYIFPVSQPSNKYFTFTIEDYNVLKVIDVVFVPASDLLYTGDFSASKSFNKFGF